MPRDSQLLNPTSKALLRAARAGCIYIRQAAKEPEDIDMLDKEITEVEEQPVVSTAAPAPPKAERSFVARKWATVPRHMEPPEVEFLAKRRPGLPSLYGAAAMGADGTTAVPQMRRTRFKKVDPASGNVSVYEAWVPEGHRIEGEIAADMQVVPENSEATVTPEMPAPGTVVEGVGTVNSEGVVVAEAGSASVSTPPKRRPPPPKRKGKGFKGRRKKVMFAPGEGGDASAVHGAGTRTGDGSMEPDGVKEEDGDASRAENGGQEDEDEDGDEGEESDEGEGDESTVDAKTPEQNAQSATEPATESAVAKSEPSSSEQQATPAVESEPDFQVSEAQQLGEQAPAENPTTEDVQMADAHPSELPADKVKAEPQEDTDKPAPESAGTSDSTKELGQTEQTGTPEESTAQQQQPEPIKAEEQDEGRHTMDTSPDQQPEQSAAQEGQQQQQQQEQQEEKYEEKEEQPQAEPAAESENTDLLDHLEKSLDGPTTGATEQTKPEPGQEQEQEQEQSQDKAGEPVEQIPEAAAEPAPKPEPVEKVEEQDGQQQPAETQQPGKQDEQQPTEQQPEQPKQPDQPQQEQEQKEEEKEAPEPTHTPAEPAKPAEPTETTQNPTGLAQQEPNEQTEDQQPHQADETTQQPQPQPQADQQSTTEDPVPDAAAADTAPADATSAGDQDQPKPDDSAAGDSGGN